MSEPFQLQFFDRNQDHTIIWGKLPHWAQAGTICFITWRMADSLPKEAIQRLETQRVDVLTRLRIDPQSDWKRALAKLPVSVRAHVHWTLFQSWDNELDNAAGSCVLQEPPLAAIVMKSLRHFDGDRYLLTDAVVMPNHLHLLVAFRDEASLITQCTSWKRFTATEINRWLKNKTGQLSPVSGRLIPSPAIKGEFWQVDQFDHLVRNVDEFAKYRVYVADNPTKAKLSAGGFLYYSRQLS